MIELRQKKRMPIYGIIYLRPNYPKMCQNVPKYILRHIFAKFGPKSKIGSHNFLALFEI